MTQTTLTCDAVHPHTGARCTLLAGHVGSHEAWGTWPATGRSGWVRWCSEPVTPVTVGAREAPDRLRGAE